MRKLSLLIILTGLSVTTHAQTWLGVGNTLQRASSPVTGGFLYRFSMGSPGFVYFYNKGQVDSLFSLAALDANVLHKIGDETGSGYKTFTDGIFTRVGSNFPFSGMSAADGVFSFDNADSNIALYKDYLSFTKNGTTTPVTLSLKVPTLTAGRTINLPDDNGTVALDENVVHLTGETSQNIEGDINLTSIGSLLTTHGTRVLGNGSGWTTLQDWSLLFSDIPGGRGRQFELSKGNNSPTLIYSQDEISIDNGGADGITILGNNIQDYDGKYFLKTGDAPEANKNNFLGLLYNNSNFISITDFTANGATPTTSAGALIITASNTTLTDFTKSVDATAIGTTDYDKWSINASFTAPTPSATTQGIWFGMRSSNTTGSNFSNSLAGIDVSNGVNAGTLYIRGGNNANTLFATSATKLTIAAGDIIQITVTRSLWSWTARAVNITNPQADVTCFYTSTGPLISGMQNAGNFAIFTQTTTPISINSFTVYTRSLKNPDIVILGNSKSMGKASSNYLTSIAGLFSINFSVVNISGGGDGTAEILRTLPSAIALNPKVVILDGVGRNDIAAGVPIATTEANIASMVTQLQAAGIQVVINTGYYETTVNQTALQVWAIANYPSLVVDNLKATSADLSSQYTDNIHATDVAFAITYQADIASGLLKSSHDLTSISNQITAPQTANTVYAAPDGLSGIPAFRALTKPDLYPIFGGNTVSGTLDWNDITNRQPGFNNVILNGTATNGNGFNSNYHVLSVEGGATKDGTHQLLQQAIPYGSTAGAPISQRGFNGTTWANWERIPSYNNVTPATGQVLVGNGTNFTLTTPTGTGTPVFSIAPSLTGLTTVQGFRPAYRAITAATTITTSDYSINATSGTFSQPLPAALGQGQIIVVGNSGAGVITLTATSIMGAASYVINPGKSVGVQYTGVSGIYMIMFSN